MARSGSLDAEQALLIREARASGVTIKEISAQFGVCKTTVRDVIYGRSYVHAGGPIAPAPKRKYTGAKTRLEIGAFVYWGGTYKAAQEKWGVSSVTVHNAKFLYAEEQHKRAGRSPVKTTAVAEDFAYCIRTNLGERIAVKAGNDAEAMRRFEQSNPDHGDRLVYERCVMMAERRGRE